MRASDGLSRLVSAADDDSHDTFSYDSLSDGTSDAINGQATISLFDGAGNVLERTYPGGRQFTCSYDVDERLANINDDGSTIASFSYVGTSRVKQVSYGNGVIGLFNYDGVSNAVRRFWSKEAGARPLLEAARTNYD